MNLSRSATIMEQFHLQKFVTRVKKQASENLGSSSGSSRALSWIRNLGTSALDVYHLGFGTELSVTPDSSVLLEAYGDGKDGKGHRSKAVFTQKAMPKFCSNRTNYLLNLAANPQFPLLNLVGGLDRVFVRITAWINLV